MEEELKEQKINQKNGKVISADASLIEMIEIVQKKIYEKYKIKISIVQATKILADKIKESKII